MTYARIVQSDNSQAERLSKEFRQGNDIVLRDGWQRSRYRYAALCFLIFRAYNK